MVLTSLSRSVFFSICLLFGVTLFHLGLPESVDKHHHSLQSEPNPQTDQKLKKYWKEIQPFFQSLRTKTRAGGLDYNIRTIAISVGGKSEKFALNSILFEVEKPFAQLSSETLEQIKLLQSKSIQKQQLENQLANVERNMPTSWRDYYPVFVKHKVLLSKLPSNLPYFFIIDQFVIKNSWGTYSPGSDYSSDDWPTGSEPYFFSLHNLTFQLLLGGVSAAQFDIYLSTTLPTTMKLYKQIFTFFKTLNLDSLPSAFFRERNNDFEAYDFGSIKQSVKENQSDFLVTFLSTQFEIDRLYAGGVNFQTFKKEITEIPGVSFKTKTSASWRKENTKNLAIGLGTLVGSITVAGAGGFAYWFLKIRKS